MRLSQLTDELKRKQQIEFAWEILPRYFSATEPKRFVAGLAMTEDIGNPRELSVKLPIPLLLEHDWLRPIGKVFGVEAGRDGIRFKAEVANHDCVPWIEDVWRAISQQDPLGVSRGIHERQNAAYGKSWTDWALDEISIVANGADRRARICRAWTKAPVVYTDGRPSETLLWDEAAAPVVPELRFR